VTGGTGRLLPGSSVIGPATDYVYGDAMKVKLREEDRRALDLLLDRSPTAAGKTAGTPVYAAVDGHIRERVVHIEKVLNILDVLPAGDPPRDLLARTLQFVEQPARRALRESGHEAPSLFNDRPPVA
jgi:hypothetical protein